MKMIQSKGIELKGCQHIVNYEIEHSMALSLENRRPDNICADVNDLVCDNIAYPINDLLDPLIYNK